MACLGIRQIPVSLMYRNGYELSTALLLSFSLDLCEHLYYDLREMKSIIAKHLLDEQ